MSKGSNSTRTSGANSTAASTVNVRGGGRTISGRAIGTGSFTAAQSKPFEHTNPDQWFLDTPYGGGSIDRGEDIYSGEDNYEATPFTYNADGSTNILTRQKVKFATLNAAKNYIRQQLRKK